MRRAQQEYCQWLYLLGRELHQESGQETSYPEPPSGALWRKDTRPLEENGNFETAHSYRVEAGCYVYKLVCN